MLHVTVPPVTVNWLRQSRHICELLNVPEISAHHGERQGRRSCAAYRKIRHGLRFLPRERQAETPRDQIFPFHSLSRGHGNRLKEATWAQRNEQRSTRGLGSLRANDAVSPRTQHLRAIKGRYRFVVAVRPR